MLRAVCLPHPHPSGMSHLHPHTGVSCAPSCCRFFSAQLGFPSRWVSAQPNVFTYSSKTLGGRAPWGSGSPPPPRGTVGTSLAFPECRHTHFPQCITSLCCHHRHREWAEGVGKALLCRLPCPWIMKALEGEEKGGGPVSPSLGVGLPQALLGTGLPS